MPDFIIVKARQTFDLLMKLSRWQSRDKRIFSQRKQAKQWKRQPLLSNIFDFEVENTIYFYNITK